MDLKSFLETIVPATGVKIVAVAVKDGERKFFRHYKFESFDDMATKIVSLASEGMDVYFALASYKQGFHENSNGKKVIRVQNNVSELQALWLDIDLKDSYPDLHSVGTAIADFCARTRMPKPALIVASGHGVHAYWPFATPIPKDRWERLSGAFKHAGIDVELVADWKCSTDSARILRPIATFNHKDPENPVPVKLLYTSGQKFQVTDLEDILLPWMEPAKAPANAINSDLTGGMTSKPERPSSFEEIIKHCAVASHHVTAHGGDAAEPEWVAMLQLLKHCEDGADWVHKVSDGHPGYSHGATESKWQARLANDVGPSLCKSFSLYRPTLCAKCPHLGFIKTPLHLGYGDTRDIAALPNTWRVNQDGNGIERLMITDPATNTREWVKVLRHMFANLRLTRDAETGQHTVSFDVWMKNSEVRTVSMPTAYFGNFRRCVEELAGNGIIFKGKEAQAFHDLMATWLERVQKARRVSDTTGQQGWMISNGKVIGFSCGVTTFHSDGREREDVRPARDFEQFAEYYTPRGGLDTWKEVATFIANQNNPALTAVLAASFGAPLLRFTGLEGGMLSIVSSASGVGKSSALKTAQAVWGNPVTAISSVDDTVKSVAKKCTYLRHLPSFWDELRGKETLEAFAPLAYMITQGKDRTRLTQTASMAYTGSWELMMIVASNESIFDLMARSSRGSDAGVVRVFEIYMDQHPDATRRSDTTVLFGKLKDNYGHAGMVYAKYLATHADEVRKMVEDTFIRMGDVDEYHPAHRFWYSIMSVILVGAMLAAKLDLVHIDIKTLYAFLQQNLRKLEDRALTMTSTSRVEEILTQFFQSYAGSSLVVDKFPERKQNSLTYSPLIINEPRTGKVLIHMSTVDKKVRFPLATFEEYLNRNNLPMTNTVRRVKEELKATQCRPSLGIGTKYVQPRSICLEVPLTDGMDFRSDDSSNPDDNPDSPVD